MRSISEIQADLNRLGKEIEDNTSIESAVLRNGDDVIAIGIGRHALVILNIGARVYTDASGDDLEVTTEELA